MSVDMVASLPVEAQSVAVESPKAVAVWDWERVDTVFTALATGLAIVAVSALTVAMNLF